MRVDRSALCLIAVVLTAAPAFAQPASIQRRGPERALERLAELTSIVRLAAGGVATPDLVSLASERRTLLAAAMETTPAAALTLSLSGNARRALSPDVQELVEYETALEGDVEVLYEDYDTGARLRRFIRVNGRRVAVHFASEPPEMSSGDRIEVRGVRLDDDLVADGGSATVVQVGTALPYTFGEQRVLVILVNFQDKPTQQPYTVSTARNLVFGTVSDFDRENSQGQTWLAGDVVGWYTIPVNSTVCDTTAIRNSSQAAAQAAGIVLSNYRRLVYAFPSNSGCAWWGMGQVGGSQTHAWINGTLATRVVAHELGHNLGVYHARALECGSVVLGTSCSTIEYGNPADIMGISGVVAHFNAFHKERMGWLNYGSSLPILTVQGEGAYVIEPYASLTDGPKALKILKSIDPSTGKRTWYYVEFRRGYGFDSSLSGNANLANGVVIHIGSEGTANSSYVLDMTPETSSWSDAALVAGRSFNDPDAGVTITTVSTGTSGATVHVQIESAACGTTPPALSVTSAVSQTAVAGATLTYRVSVRNDDDPRCAASMFHIGASGPLGWQYAPVPATVSLPPGSSASVSVGVTSSSSAAEGSYTIALTATDQVSGQSAASPVAYGVIGALTVAVATDKPVYARGQSVKITADVAAGMLPMAGVPVSVVITKPNGSRVTVSGTTAASGTAAFNLRLKPKDPLGSYTVTVSASMGTVMASGGAVFLVQ